jgi:hypothetical protein
MHHVANVALPTTSHWRGGLAEVKSWFVVVQNELLDFVVFLVPNLAHLRDNEQF